MFKYRPFYSDVISATDGQLTGQADPNNDNNVELVNFSLPDIDTIHASFVETRGRDRFGRTAIVASGYLGTDVNMIKKMNTIGGMLRMTIDSDDEFLCSVPNTVSAYIACLMSGSYIVSVGSDSIIFDERHYTSKHTSHMWGMIIDFLFTPEKTTHTSTAVPLIIYGYDRSNEVFLATAASEDSEIDVKIAFAKINCLATSFCIKQRNF